MESYPLNNILVIDEVPTIALGLLEVFRPINHDVAIEQVENVFTALSSRLYEEKKFDCIIIGEQMDRPSADISRMIAECKARFGGKKIILYSPNYDHAIIEEMEAAGIDAYIHKYEPIEEIRKAYNYLTAGEGYISDIFHTLYYEYCFRLGQFPK